MTSATTVTPAIARSLSELPCEWKSLGVSGKANSSRWIQGKFIAMEGDGFRVKTLTRKGEIQIIVPYPVHLRIFKPKSKEET